MIQTNPFSNVKRFIGDERKKIVHDKLYEAKFARLRSCGLDELPANNARTFDPDTLEEAKKQGFTPCQVCLWVEHGFGK